MKSIGVYWLTLEPHENHLKKAAMLDALGYRVTFFKTLDSLAQGIFDQRVPIVIVGDEGPENAVINAIRELGHMPAMQGARMLLTVSRPALPIMRIAACEGFRDILALDMPHQEWLERFIFSSSSSKTLTKQFDNTGLQSYREEGFLALPARIVWITDQQICIESRLKPRLHQKIELSGPIVQSMGAKYLTVTPTEVYHTNLLFRFSEGLIGTWEIPEGSADNHRTETMDIVRTMDRGERYRIFLAINSPAMRNSLIKYLEPERFEVHSALHKRSLIEEPKYFGPQVVILEDRFHHEGELAQFRQWVATLPPHCAIIIIGGRTELQQIRNLVGGRLVLTFKHIPTNFRSLLLEDVIPRCTARLTVERSHIPPQHEFSLAEVRIDARLLHVGPKSVRLRINEPLSGFSLARIRSPFFDDKLAKKPFVKITAALAQQDPAQEDPCWELECRFSDMTAAEQRRITELLQPQIAPLTPEPSATPGSTPIVHRAMSEFAPEVDEPTPAAISLTARGVAILMVLVLSLMALAYWAGTQRRSPTHRSSPRTE